MSGALTSRRPATRDSSATVAWYVSPLLHESRRRAEGRTPLVVAALCNRGTIIFLPCDFYLLSIVYLLSFSSPNLSGHRLDLYHTSAHGVALVRI